MPNELTTRQLPGLEDTPGDLDISLAEGLASKQLTEQEFWGSVDKQTDELLSQARSEPQP